MDPADAGAAEIAVEVIYCPAPGQVDRTELRLPTPATAQEAVQASGVLARHALAVDGLRLGVWCRACELETLLRDRDRVEIYRPLTVDPKEARRLRYKKARERVPAR
jgi:uncharacterized protein